MDYTNIIEVHGERAGRLRPPFVPSTRDYGWQSKATAAERRAGGREVHVALCSIICRMLCHLIISPAQS